LLGEQLPIQAGRGPDTGDHMIMDDPVQRPVPVRRTALELRLEDLPGEIMRGQPTGPAMHERPAPQPPPYLGGVGADRLAEQVLGRQPGSRAGRQAGHVSLGGRVPQQRLEQHRDQVGYVGETLRDGAAAGHVGQQRERQWVATPQHQQPLPARLGDADPGEQVRAVGLVEMVDALSGDHLPPARVHPPGGRRRLAPGEDHEAVRRQDRDEVPAQPAVDGTQMLVRVDQQHRAVVGGLLDRLEKALRGRVDLSAVQHRRNPAGGPGPGGHLQEQRGLADATRTVHEQHPPRRPPGQRVAEGPQLVAAADEVPPPRPLDDVPEDGSHHRLSLGLSDGKDQHASPDRQPASTTRICRSRPRKATTTTPPTPVRPVPA